MNAGAPARFPELTSHNWMLVHADLGATSIAGILGCAPSTVRRKFQEMGLWIRVNVPYTQWEDAALYRFFPHYPTEVLAQAMGRTFNSVNRRAITGMGLKKLWGNERRGEDEFWTEWQEYLYSEESRSLVDNEFRSRFLGLTYAPSLTQCIECYKCLFEMGCVGSSTHPLPCMNTTVLDAMEWGDRMNIDQLGYLEIEAASGFLKEVKRIDTNNRWEEADLDDLLEKLKKWRKQRRAHRKARAAMLDLSQDE